MIIDIVKKMEADVDFLKNSILLDIEDVQLANHEKLLDRNDIKLEKMNNIANLKNDLNEALLLALKNDEDVDKYRDVVDSLEDRLLELSNLNAKLASIVLPVQQMYKEIIDQITHDNGGSLVEVLA